MKKGNLLLLGILLSLFAVTLISLAKTANDETPEICAVITRLDGKVLFKPERKSKWLKAEVGMGLIAGDTIKTGTDSIAVVVLEGGTVFRIGRSSEIIIRMLTVNLSKKQSETELEIIKEGSILAKASRIKKKRTIFRTRTPTCVASVRGTGLEVEVEDEETTNILVIEGKVVIKDFVEESMLPEESEELLLMVMHEVSLKSRYTTTVTKDGIKKPKKISKKLLAEKKESLKELKRISKKLQAEWNKTTLEERSLKRKNIRDRIISSGK